MNTDTPELIVIFKSLVPAPPAEDQDLAQRNRW